MQYAIAAKTARMTAVLNLLPGGRIEIGTANMATVLVTFNLDATPGTVSGDVLTLSDLPINDTAADADGTAAAARFVASNGTPVITGLTVGLASADPQPDVVIQNTDIKAGQPVSIVVGTITHS